MFAALAIAAGAVLGALAATGPLQRLAQPIETLLSYVGEVLGAGIANGVSLIPAGLDHRDVLAALVAVLAPGLVAVAIAALATGVQAARSVVLVALVALAVGGFFVLPGTVALLLAVTVVAIAVPLAVFTRVLLLPAAAAVAYLVVGFIVTVLTTGSAPGVDTAVALIIADTGFGAELLWRLGVLAFAATPYVASSTLLLRRAA
jgi:hypothetical protein